MAARGVSNSLCFQSCWQLHQRTPPGLTSPASGETSTRRKQANYMLSSDNKCWRHCRAYPAASS